MSTRETLLLRRATPEDAEALAKLRYEFRVSRRVPNESEVEFLRRCTPWMRTRLAGEATWRAWVIELNEVVVGNAWLEIIEKLPNPTIEPERHAYVTNVFVRAEYRNGGAGARLVAAVLEECERIGIDSIILWPSDRSRPLYLRHGFRPATEVLIRARPKG